MNLVRYFDEEERLLLRQHNIAKETKTVIVDRLKMSEAVCVDASYKSVIGGVIERLESMSEKEYSEVQQDFPVPMSNEQLREIAEETA